MNLWEPPKIEYNWTEWVEYYKKYELTAEARKRKWCCMCQHHFGMMVVTKRHGQVVPRGGQLIPCIHTQLMHGIHGNERDIGDV